MLHVVLLNPQIAWNTGNIGRTCIAFGAKLHLIKPLGFEISDKAVKRAGLDYWEHIQLTVHDSWKDFRNNVTFDEHLFFTAKGDVNLHKLKVPSTAKSVGLIFGAETKGLFPLIGSEEMQGDNKQKVYIPMNGSDKVRCLNLSTSVGIGIWHVLHKLQS